MTRSKKVLLAFSGGIDSVHAAGILLAGGYRVTAMTLNTTGDSDLPEQAERKAKEAGIEIEIIDARKEFEESVINYFMSEYMRGRTPAPCTVCNAAVKWSILHRKAVQGGYDHIATGHYFGIRQHGGKYYVSKASDPAKDQSYYLWMLPQHILAMALTPMSDQIKHDIKNRLKPEASRSESMGVCFLAGSSYRDFISGRCGDTIKKGDITDRDGNILGSHNGFPYYTIGQKKGLEISGGRCVTGIDPASNRIIAGYDADLWHKNLIVSGLVSPDTGSLLNAGDLNVKIRGFGRNPEGTCNITRHSDGLYKVALENPAWAAAPGQPVVLYRNDLVVGGGFLEHSF